MPRTRKHLSDGLSVLTLPPSTAPSAPRRKPAASVSEILVSFWGGHIYETAACASKQCIQDLYSLNSTQTSLLIRGHGRWSKTHLYGTNGWISPWPWTAWGNQDVYRSWANLQPAGKIRACACVCTCVRVHVLVESKGRGWVAVSSWGAETEQAGRPSFWARGPDTCKELRFQATLRRALHVSEAVLLHGSPRHDLLGMTVQGRKNTLAVRGWAEFLRLMGIRSLPVAAGGERCLLSVFIQVFLFEHQPHWLWFEKKLIWKPWLEISWLLVYCLSTHTKEKLRHLSVFKRAACFTQSARESHKSVPGFPILLFFLGICPFLRWAVIYICLYMWSPELKRLDFLGHLRPITSVLFYYGF